MTVQAAGSRPSATSRAARIGPGPRSTTAVATAPSRRIIRVPASAAGSAVPSRSTWACR
ncbi:hypothetical protein Ae406Ps2_3002c [Pseudonocardia sp. Ae406_Ps2]|nr:hypothetical protein Ae331Ps2_2925 [Pseudonocardia sp. Ae331_Ps2]OLM03002.1 hypothetical protein Ae406Ps2_3002c [Pseudonocardia sp. Ae406_Ps2]OLM12144.1 hypothetical protein Ae505Ps2_2271 [Pseudonocardia sp. Ae505_Ps2]OLM24578.1 hypothetical protein Ae706Ps2_3011c [Pseudonocardia sp. Ae706_Ps2]